MEDLGVGGDIPPPASCFLGCRERTRWSRWRCLSWCTPCLHLGWFTDSTREEKGGFQSLVLSLHTEGINGAVSTPLFRLSNVVLVCYLWQWLSAKCVWLRFCDARIAVSSLSIGLKWINLKIRCLNEKLAFPKWVDKWAIYEVFGKLQWILQISKRKIRILC